MAKKSQITQESFRLYSTPKGISHLIAKLRVSLRFTLLLAGVGLPLSVEKLMFTWTLVAYSCLSWSAMYRQELGMGNYKVTEYHSFLQSLVTLSCGGS